MEITMDSTTLKNWNDGGQPAGYYLPTFNGFAEVGGIDANWCAHCPSENDGFGLGFRCTPNTAVYEGDAIVKTFGDMDCANQKICTAGGNVRKALKMVSQ